MNTPPPDGGPAFAAGVPAVPIQHDSYFQTGMSLRDWFAGMAMQGMMSNHQIVTPVEIIARHSFDVADAMLKEKAKRE